MAIISVLVGTVRSGRQGIKLANYVVNTLEKSGHTVHLIDPVVYPSLQSFTERYRYNNNPSQDLAKVSALLEASEGFVAVSPEYNYSYSPQFKMILDYFFNEFKFKPFALLSYSAGPFAGVRAIEQMRSVTNVLGGVPVPTTFGLPSIGSAFDEEGDLIDPKQVSKLESALKEFEWYTAALGNHRKVDSSILPRVERLV